VPEGGRGHHEGDGRRARGPGRRRARAGGRARRRDRRRRPSARPGARRHPELSRTLHARSDGAGPRGRVRRPPRGIGLRRHAGPTSRHPALRRPPPRTRISPGSRRCGTVMRLGALVAGTDVRPISGSLDVDVAGVAIDSRRVAPGDVFFALTGRHTDGRRHVADAVARGALAIVTHEAVDGAPATVLAAANPRAVLARVAARLAGDPSAQMTLVGVTGTNGKTTITHLLEGIWQAAGHVPGVIGTIAYRSEERRVGKECRSRW